MLDQLLKPFKHALGTTVSSAKFPAPNWLALESRCLSYLKHHRVFEAFDKLAMLIFLFFIIGSLNWVHGLRSPQHGTRKVSQKKTLNGKQKN